MSYNILDIVHKMQVTLPIMKVRKILQQKEFFFKALEEETLKENRIKENIMTHKP